MKILLEAPILTQSGYGEHSRLVFKSLMNLRGIDVYINPLSWGQTGWISTRSKLRNLIERSISNFRRHEDLARAHKAKSYYDMHLHVGILNEFEPKSQNCISITAGIETDRVSPEWLAKIQDPSNFINSIIVPSEHARDSFMKTEYKVEKEGKTFFLFTTRPVKVVPYPVKKVEANHLNLNLDTKFNFLSIALLGPRKNLENTIRWFVKEFKNEDVGLVLKTSRSTGSIIDREITTSILKSVLEEKENLDRKCKVYLLHGDLTESQIHSLYHRKDIQAYATTTRGEGYGLPIFEAAYSGMPVIAPDWSGHLDFLSAPVKKNGKVKNKKLFAKVDYTLKEVDEKAIWPGVIVGGSRWVEPSELSFRKQLRNVYKNYGLYKKNAKLLQHHINDTNEESKILSSMRRAILGDGADDMLMTTEDLLWNERVSKIEKL